MTTRTTESFKHNKDAVLPVILSAIGFLLSIAGWWLAWLAGLAVLVIWLVLLCFMDYLPQVQHILLVTIILASITSLAELFVMANINDAASCGDKEDGCNWLSPPLRMIVAGIAAILWGCVAYITFLRYRAKTVDVPAENSPV
mmetsp:Transcript_7891/g.15290  ORF Transcript_7891/g.15290 Transcript_7891/m.15290 type:complete len:143 (+) Transcript_7891:104-532(+)